MKTIRIRVRLDSDTLKAPELREFVGKDVEVTVTEQSNGGKRPLPSVDPFDFNANLGGWPDDDSDGFEEALRRWRKEDTGRGLPA
jgi:hypothetical protein